MTEPHQRARGRVRARFHAASGVDWKAVELAFADGWSVRELSRKFGIAATTIYSQTRVEAWRRELSRDARAALEAEVEVGKVLAPLPQGERCANGQPRGARWGRSNKCDWLRMELEYGLGEEPADIARKAGVSVEHVRLRARREGWREDLPVAESQEMQRRVLGAEAARLMLDSRFAEARDKLRMMAAVGGVTERVKKAEGETDADRDTGVQDIGPGSEVHRLLVARIAELRGRQAAGATAGGAGAGGGKAGDAGAATAAEVAGPKT
jgi:hypothetical protein